MPPGTNKQNPIENNVKTTKHITSLSVTLLALAALTAHAQNLVWRAQIDTNWDIGTTANWVNGATPSTYSEGATVLFDDSTSNALVYVTTTVAPASVTVGNSSAKNYNFTGVGKITGATALTKTNTGTFTLSLANDYSGGTTNGGGVLRLATEGAIGTGPLRLNGGTLSWADTAPHTLTNKLIVGGNVTVGAANNGVLTVTNTVDFAGGDRIPTCASDVLFASGLNNGTLGGKRGTGTLTVKNGAWTRPAGSVAYQEGTLTLDNSAVVQPDGNVRVQCNVANSSARMVITNGGSLVMSSLTAGRLFVVGGGTTVGTTNVLDLAGTLTMLPAANTSGKLIMGEVLATDGAQTNFVNLLPGGVLKVKTVIDPGGATVNTFNFNGGTLVPTTNQYSGTFMQGLDYCYVLDGGAIVDTAGYDPLGVDIAIRQALLVGGSGIGGLTKLGAGMLTLNTLVTNNNYTGPTVVNGGTLTLRVQNAVATSSTIIVGAGATFDVSPLTSWTLGAAQTLKGNGIVNGNPALYSFTVNGTVAPGTSIGTLTLTNCSPTLQGTMSMKINRTNSPNADKLIVTSDILEYGGTLMVTNIGPPLASGDTFDLFDVVDPFTFSGSFTATNLPALLPGLSWDLSNLDVDGTIKVTGTVVQPQPTFNPVSLQNGTNLILSGSGGVAGSTYYVLTSTNAALPLPSWARLSTNVFEAGGTFTNNILVNPAEKVRFFDIDIPLP